MACTNALAIERHCNNRRDQTSFFRSQMRKGSRRRRRRFATQAAGAMCCATQGATQGRATGDRCTTSERKRACNTTRTCTRKDVHTQRKTCNKHKDRNVQRRLRAMTCNFRIRNCLRTPCRWPAVRAACAASARHTEERLLSRQRHSSPHRVARTRNAKNKDCMQQTTGPNAANGVWDLQRWPPANRAIRPCVGSTCVRQRGASHVLA